MNSIYYRFFKRLFDLVFSFLFLIIFLPFFVIISILVLFNIGWPIIFSQKRPGKNEKIFKLYKFMSMKNIRDEKGNLLPDEMRLTRLGKFLRRTSLDELPELINIFLGHMSFIGPRPLLVIYLERYNDEQKRRHLVRPGLTGLAQVSGRNLLTWSEKFKLDIKYIENLSFKNDVKIFFSTIKVVFTREGISPYGSEITEEFTGDN